MQFILLKRLVGERGFEPPTPWSRTRCSTRLSHSPTDGWMTTTTGTTWRLELRQYSILRLANWSRGLHVLSRTDANFVCCYRRNFMEYRGVSDTTTPYHDEIASFTGRPVALP